MFGTIIIDTYSKKEVNEIAIAIDELCSPNDSLGWSSAGIYSFWDINTLDILYIGLASDLANRFKQHNGIINISSSGSKYKKIKNYFETNEKIGYSIFVQSSLSQPDVARNKKFEMRDFENIGNEGIEYIKNIEGQLIEAYKLANNRLPLWNEIGGSALTRKYSTVNNYHQIVQNFAINGLQNPIVAKCTIRELSSNPSFEMFEEQLHGIRILMFNHGLSFKEAVSFELKSNIYFSDYWQRILEDDYLEKKIILS